MLQGIEGWLAEQIERGSDAPVDTLENQNQYLRLNVWKQLIRCMNNKSFVVHERFKQLNNSFSGLVYGNTMNQRSMDLHNGLLQQALKTI